MKSNSFIRLGLCILCLQFLALKHIDAQRKIDNLYYNIDAQNKTAKVTRSANSDYGMNKNYVSGDIIIPASINDKGNLYQVIEIEDAAFSGCTGLNSVTIMSDEIRIGQGAFSGCTNLSSINFSGAFTSLGEYAFYHTAWENAQEDGLIYLGKSLIGYKGQMPDGSHIAVDDGTVSIADGAFRYSMAIAGVSFPSTLRQIGKEAFYGCSSVKNVEIPASVVSIGDNAFAYCSGMTSAIVSCTTIGNGMFLNCENLGEIEISSTVESIGDDAFAYTGLTNVSVPSSVYNIGRNLFVMCENLTTAEINCHIIGERMFSGSALKSVSISDKTEIIGSGSFETCDNLSFVSIPSSVRTIGEYNQEIKGKTNVEIIPVSA